MTSTRLIVFRWVPPFVAQIPVLENYRLRCEARPAFQRALAAQLAVFQRHAA